MSDFLGGAEISVRAGMLNMNNTLEQAKVEASKTTKTDKSGEISEADKAKELARIRDVSQQFESIFLSYMMKQMKKTIPEDSLFGDSNAKDIFYDMHYDNLGKEMSKAGGIGLATILYNQLAKNVDNVK
jgi:flagellar protein FlgJ